MVACADARTLISRELDDEIDVHESAALDAHVESCAGCRRERVALARLEGLLDESFAAHPFDAAFARKVAQTATRAPRVVELRGRGTMLGLSGGILAFVAAAAALAMVVLPPGQDPANVVPSSEPRVALARVEGKGLMIRDTSGEHAVAPGATIHARERVLNGGAAPVTLVLLDGTRVAVRPDTSVELRADRDEGTTVAVVGQGEVYCEVQKRLQPFRVAGGPLTVTVMGTRFGVRVEPSATQVVVAEGLVKVAEGGRESIQLAANQGTRFDESARLRPRPVDPRAELAWHPRYAAPVTVNETAPPAPAAPDPRPTPPVRPADSDPTGLDQPVTGEDRKKPPKK